MTFKIGKRNRAAISAFEKRLNIAEETFKRLSKGDLSEAEFQNTMSNIYMIRAAIAANLMCIAEHRAPKEERFTALALYHLRNARFRATKYIKKYVVKFMSRSATWEEVK